MKSLVKKSTPILLVALLMLQSPAAYGDLSAEEVAAMQSVSEADGSGLISGMKSHFDNMSSFVSENFDMVQGHVMEHQYVYGTAAAMATVYAAMKLYDAGKSSAARSNSSNSTLKNRLNSIEARLENPNLSDESRDSLENDRHQVLEDLKAEYFDDKGFVDTLMEVLKAAVPVV